MEKPRRVMGIDPGLKGGIALIGVDDDSYGVLPMPATNEATAQLIVKLSHRWHIVLAGIERVQSMPNNAASAMLAYGKHSGFIECACLLSDIPLRNFVPMSWQKTVTGLLSARPKAPNYKGMDKAKRSVEEKAHAAALRMHRKGTKQRSIQIARQRYPKIASQLGESKDGLADALHICRYTLSLFREL